MRKHHIYLLILCGIFAAGLILTGCSSKSDILKEVSGQWQDNQDNGAVEINLTGEPKSIKVGDQTYSVSIDQIVMDRYQVNLKVKNGSEQPELWTIREIWNDVGSSFKIAFEHSGKSRMLVPKG